MDWFNYIRENIWVGVLFASVLTSVVVAFINLTEKGSGVENTKLNIICAIFIGIAVTNFGLDWGKFSSYQDTAIRLVLTVILPYLVAKAKGQDIVDSLVAKVVEGAKNFNIGKKDGQP